MKILSTILIISYCASTIYSAALCTPGKCSNCQGDSQEGLYCKSCYKSVLKGTAADLTDGFCEGDSTGIANCLVTTREGSTVKCKTCENGYMTQNGGASCTSITVTNCNVWFETSSSAGYCGGCINGQKPNLLGTACSTNTPYPGCFSIGQLASSPHCVVCELGKMRNEAKTECVNGTANDETCNRFSTTQPGEWCASCNVIMGYLPYKVSNMFKTGDDRFQQCK